MKNLTKKTKMIILTVIIILGLWAGLMAVDSYRFFESDFSVSKGADSHKPFVTLSSEKDDDFVSYTGLGYTLSATAKTENEDFISEKVLTVFGLDIFTVKITH